MFCKKCGSEMPDESKFCSKCGYNYVEDRAANSNKSNKKPLWLVLVRLVVIAILTIGLCIALFMIYAALSQLK